MKPEFIHVQQGSDLWLKMRLGVITASKVYDLFPDKRSKTPKEKESRQTYMNELIGEVCTGYSEELNAKALAWGHENEPAARAAYAFTTGHTITEGGFAYNFNKRCGCSPDFMVTGANKGGEIKCPITPKVHVDTILNGIVKPEYVAQIQYSMWVSGLDEWDFVSFHPRMKSNMVHIINFKRDEEMMKLFNEIIPRFVEDMDEALKTFGVKFGNQWLLQTQADTGVSA